MVHSIVLLFANTFKMKYIIPKGWHFSLPWIPKIHWNKDEYTWNITLNNSCKYDHGTDDQLDWNKLVGISNTLNPRIDSLRIVWRYNKETDFFEIGLYTEKNKEFTAVQIASIKADETLKINLKCYYTYALVEVKDKLFMANFQKEYVTIGLRPYFGGNMPAPHTMKLNITK